jgi:hypothetical protein
VVLWLVPSNTILDQTADALRDPRHPYRRALELACGTVEVVTIEEALRLSRATGASAAGRNPRFAAAYLNASLAEGDQAAFMLALRDVAKPEAVFPRSHDKQA